MAVFRRLIALFGIACFLTVGARVSAESPIKVELNKLENYDGACRAYLVFENTTTRDFTVFKLDLVMFGADGVIAKRLAVDTAPLHSAKTSVKLFDLAKLRCADIGRILINDIIECRDQRGKRTDCVSLVETSSRSTVPLVK